jgi:tetratricopeptide (TPR) repeat protein
VVIPSINHGLVSMSRNYFADQKVIEDLAQSGEGDLIEKIETFYARQDSIFGFIAPQFSLYLNFVANDFRDLEKYDEALALYEWAFEMEPTGVKYLVNVADTYDKKGDQAMAKKTFTEVLELMEKEKKNLSEGYYRDVSKWIREKLEGYE